MLYADLHTHTTASDGAMTPSELVSFAKKNNVGYLAITDHDTISGLKEGKDAGEKHGVFVINGVELSADYKRALHILGLFVDEPDEEFLTVMEELKKFREQRNLKMIDALSDMGFDITAEDILSVDPTVSMDSAGRVHMARVLCQKGYASDIKTAFKKYLSGTSKAYVSRQKLSPKECIELIHKAKGYAFLAHGVSCESDIKRLLSLIDELKGIGLDGVECYHSDIPEDMSAVLEGYCKKNSLMISAGSDFHGENKPHVKLASLPYGKKIDESFIKDILSQIKK